MKQSPACSRALRNRRNALAWAAAGVAGWITAAPRGAQAQAASGAGPLTVEVWKSPTCSCCAAWITHLERSGFRVTVHDVGNTAARARLRIPARLGSCHTARVQGYAIEGHVPATDILRLLKERPAAVGLAVPGMPLGSPGMDGPDYGFRTEPYEVLLVAQDGSTAVFNRYLQKTDRP